MKAIIVIGAFVILWATASNIQQGHRITAQEVEIRALQLMVKECKWKR